MLITHIQLLETNLKVAKVVSFFIGCFSKAIQEYAFKLIDTYKATVNGESFSNRKYHLDQYHLSPNAIPIIQRQLDSL